jgi:uncharacterized protein with NAD-binding domain and iron-sulfur cluster
VTADYYIAALPVEVMAPLVTSAMLHAAPTLGGLPRLAGHTRWMNGIQFYLDRASPIVHGHVIYPDTAFRLTSVSQAQFWPDIDMSNIGDGVVRDILSVDISDWTANGPIYQKPAQELTPQQIKEEVWSQLLTVLNRDGVVRLAEDSLHSWHLDDDIVDPNPAGAPANLEPLLINTKGSWDDRPDATIGIDNLFLAGDYVRTYTDLATMEAANEAARRAVNGILNHLAARGHGDDIPRCDVWPLAEPGVFAPLREGDKVLYHLGHGHHSVSNPGEWRRLLGHVV